MEQTSRWMAWPMLHDDNEIICVAIKGAGHKFHSWQLERMQLLERMGAKVYLAIEKDDDPSDFPPPIDTWF